jgi:hypothetical protein
MEENMKRIFLIAIIFIIFLAPQAQAITTITFSWDASPEAVKYKVYQNTVDVFNATIKPSLAVVCDVAGLTCTVPNVPDGIHYWAATAFDSAGNESEFTASVSYNGDTTPPVTPSGFKITVTVNVNIQ